MSEKNTDEAEPAPRVAGADGTEYELRVQPPAEAGPEPRTSNDRSDQDKKEEDEEPRFHAGQVAAGGASALAVGTAGLYQVGGVWGLVAGGGAVAATGVAYGVHRWRANHPKSPATQRTVRTTKNSGSRFPGLSGMGGRGAMGGGRMGGSFSRPGTAGGASALRSGGLGRSAAAGMGPSPPSGRASRTGAGGGFFSGRGSAGGRSGGLGGTAGSRGGGGGLFGSGLGRGRSGGGSRHATADGPATPRSFKGAAGGRTGTSGRSWSPWGSGSRGSGPGSGSGPRSGRSSGPGSGRGWFGRRGRGASGGRGRSHTTDGDSLAPTASGRHRARGGRLRGAGRKIRTTGRKTVDRVKNSPGWQKFSSSRGGAFLLALLALLAWPFMWLFRLLRNWLGLGSQTPEGEKENQKNDSPDPNEDSDADSGPGPKPDGPDPDNAPDDEDDKNRQPDTDTDSGPQPTANDTKGNNMSANPLLIATSELQSTVVNHVPEDMWQVQKELRQMPQVMENVAMAFRAYAQRLQDNYPIDKTVTEQMFTLFQQIGETAGPAGEVSAIFEKVHAEEIRRREAPRPNESTWNV